MTPQTLRSVFHLCLRHFTLAILTTVVLSGCGSGGGGGSGSSGSQTGGGTNTGLVVIASGTVDPYGGTINDTLGETAVIVQPGLLSGTATITIERGRDASGRVVTRLSSSSPTAIPVDIVLPPADVVENDTPGSGTPLVAGLVTAPFLEGNTKGGTKFSCPGKNGGVDSGWFSRCSYFWKSTDFLGIGNRIESKTVAVDILGMVDITYREAAVLSSTCSFLNTSCYVDKQPVLFVHGFSPSDPKFSDNSFGGGVDTFGVFPFAIMQPGYVPFEFRWVTAARLQDVAADLGRAIDQIAKRTGKKVHVIVHSFGGVLVRTYLQGLSSGGYPYNNNVATLTTVGTPHSGIFDGDQKYNVLNGITYERGQDNQGGFLSGEAQINFCQQLSCYQIGEYVNLAGLTDSINFTRSFSQENAAAVYGVTTYPGEIAEKLFETRHQLPDIPIQVLIGMTTSRGSHDILDEGDGLITYQGQRFLPIYSSSTSRAQPLLSSFLIGKASITERILGTSNDVQPGDANPFSLDERVGYRHALLPIHPIDANPMVAIENIDKLDPYFIPSVSRTNHAAVVNAKQWILDHPSTAATSVLQFTFTGTVTDNVTNLPLSNAYLSVSRNGVDMGSGFTNSSGVYSFNLDFHPDSVYAVKISKGGYVSTDKTISTPSTLITLAGFSERLNPVVGPVVPIIHALNITKSGDGMVTGLGISCSPVCNTSFKEGELVQLFAQADQGASFSGWSGCGITSVGSRCDVTMSSDKVVTASFTLVTGATPVTTTPALSITTTSLPSATVGTGNAQGVAVSGGQTPYFWSVSSGLPSGLNINSTTGAIYGYPSVSGTFNFTVTAKDSSSPQKTASQALSLTVMPGSTTTLTCTPPQVLTNGACVTPTTTDTTKPIVSGFSVTPGSLTVGSSFTIFYTVSDSGGSGLWQAQLWRAPDIGGVPGTWAKITTTPLSGNGPVSGSFTDAPTSGTYWYGVHGVDNAINIGVEPNGAKVVVNPAGVAPTPFTLSGSAQCNGSSPQIVLSGWGSSGFATFDVYRNGSLYSSANTGSTFLNISVTAGTAYSYYVVAKNASGSTTSNTVSVTAPTSCGGTAKVVTVANTGGIGLNLRNSASVSGAVIAALPDGTTMSVIGGPTLADGFTWWNISGTYGTGWSAIAEWLTPAPQIGATVTVSYTGGAGLNLRSTASTSGAVITTLPEGAQMTVFSGPVQANGYTWWAIQGVVSGTSYTGWSAVGNWLTPNPRY